MSSAVAESYVNREKNYVDPKKLLYEYIVAVLFENRECWGYFIALCEELGYADLYDLITSLSRVEMEELKENIPESYANVLGGIYKKYEEYYM